MRSQREQVERSPFDGCVFHIRLAHGGRRRISPGSAGAEGPSGDELEPAKDDLQSIHWTKPRHDFCGSTSRRPTSTGSTTTPPR